MRNSLIQLLKIGLVITRVSFESPSLKILNESIQTLKREKYEFRKLFMHDLKLTFFVRYVEYLAEVLQNFLEVISR